MSFARFLAPRYWPTWLWLGILRVAVLLPYRPLMGLGRALGRIMQRVAGRRAHIATVNLRLCFPDLPEAERELLLRRHFESLGIAIVETALAWWGRDARLRTLVRTEGLEHLQRALSGGKGVILLGAHLTTLEIGGRLLALFHPTHAMYREHKNALFEATMRRAREARIIERAIPRGDVRAMLRSLKANNAVWYAPDQNYGREHSIFVPFFGVPAATITATSRLARMSGAPLVPFFCERLPGNAGYLLRMLPALDDVPSDDVELDTARINQVIEAEVRRVPEQYLWAHRRFKTRPPGEPDVYRVHAT